jgi:hypothetical protein
MAAQVTPVFVARLSPGKVGGWATPVACGCAGIVLAKLGASSVTLTDLAPNLPLLRINVAALLGNDGVAEVRALEWGHGLQGCTPPYDVLVGCVTC